MRLPLTLDGGGRFFGSAIKRATPESNGRRIEPGSIIWGTVAPRPYDHHLSQADARKVTFLDTGFDLCGKPFGRFLKVQHDRRRLRSTLRP